MIIQVFFLASTSATICYGIFGEVPCPNVPEVTTVYDRNAGEPDVATPAAPGPEVFF